MSLQLVPYILMNGRAKEAIEFYREALSANVLFIQTFGEGPKDSIAHFDKKILELVAHSVLSVGEDRIMIADIIPELPYQGGTQVSICITSDYISETKQFYENLKLGGKVLIELNENYFSPGYSMVMDKFGVTFQLYTNKK